MVQNLGLVGNMKKASKRAKIPQSVGGYKVLGLTEDGVSILKPKVKPRNFTIPELKKAIKETRAKKSAG